MWCSWLNRVIGLAVLEILAFLLPFYGVRVDGVHNPTTSQMYTFFSAGILLHKINIDRNPGLIDGGFTV